MNSALAKLIRVEARLMWRDIVPIVFTILLPLIILVAFGSLPGTREPDLTNGGFRAIDTVLPSVSLALALAMSAIFTLPVYIATYREKGVLRRLGTTPVRPIALLGAQLILNIALALIAVVLVLIVGKVAFGMAMPANMIGFIAALLLGLLAMYGLSVLLAARLPNARIAGGIGWAVFFPLGFTAGVWVPKQFLPKAISALGDVTPLGAFREAIQSSWVDVGPRPIHLITLAVTAVVTIAAAARWFRWQ
jgi:ABC-2 type transport system permease protein